MRNLEVHQQKVWNSRYLNGKKQAMKELIEDVLEEAKKNGKTS